MSADDPIAKLRHDLANPLAALLAETQLLLLGDVPMHEDVRFGLQQIEKAAIRMRALLRQTQAPPDA
jgi:signal transduction histidine kinase